MDTDIWDATQHSFPPMENNAFFIVTRETVAPYDINYINNNTEITPGNPGDFLFLARHIVKRLGKFFEENDEKEFL
ncbi:unnamed protein product, partial [Didymodactylos carnosus]